MAKLEHLKPGALVGGIVPNAIIELISAKWIGDQAVEIVYRTSDGNPRDAILYREDEHRLALNAGGRPWSFEADGEQFRLATEANRIKLAHHFDPFLAIHTSLVEPLPHQISAVYGEMLPRQPLRFLLADDPGAGKTIMAGLLIKELIARGDLERCLIVAPGGLVEQWQDELGQKFALEFDIFNSSMVESSRSGNPFNEHNHLIARLDVLSRNEELQEKLDAAPEWDLIICDEAHRMSATYFGSEVKYTKRYQLGQKLGAACRHFLLMSATPHNGHERDFQLFMALLDGDRFEGKYRDGVHVADTEDMMRRLTKEELLRFDGTQLFPERKAYTVKYELSEMEAALYGEVTKYVREEMNRVQRFAETDGRKRNNIGFALQILQRRLASSPAAIYQSLKRRRERLEAELAEARLVSRGGSSLIGRLEFEQDELDNIDEYGQEDVDRLEDLIATGATTAETIDQLKMEVVTLKGLERMALDVLNAGLDTKWTQLDRILDDELMTDADGHRRKLIVFTEPKDTLHYLADKIRARIGRPDAVEVIHGGVSREDRRRVVERFMQDRDMLVLVANDAAGEGVNLQRGHLMVNYDLPWNPNKIEQRFGRIHRIGQQEVCHLWNLVAAETREGEVYARLLEKLEAAREALGGRVYDVLGELFEGNSLKELLFEAIQYGERDDVKQRLFEKVDGAVDQQHLLDLLQKRALTNDAMPAARVKEIRLEMEKAEAQRLQPFHIQSFFIEAFQRLGGKIKAREDGRWEIIHVPSTIRARDRQIGTGAAIQRKYERICFDKAKINQQPVAQFICPGHPLLETVISLVREQFGSLLKQGAVLVDELDEGEDISAVFLLEHAVQDGREGAGGRPHIISERLQFASIMQDGSIHDAGMAPHLDLRAIKPEELDLLGDRVDADWLKADLERAIVEFATIELAQKHVANIKHRRLPEIEKVEREVRSRLTREINYWDNRAAELREDEKAGKKTRVNWQNADRRANDLAERLKRREAQLQLEKFISSRSPNVRGGMVVVPGGLLRSLTSQKKGIPSGFSDNADARRKIEIAAMDAVMATERALGNTPEDVSAQKVGYDILSYDPDTEHLRFIEVKGRVAGANSVMITRREIITSLNEPDKFILALVAVDNGFAGEPRYVKGAIDDREPGFLHRAIQFDLNGLLARAGVPE